MPGGIALQTMRFGLSDLAFDDKMKIDPNHPKIKREEVQRGT
jgi:hypothetical protein